MGCFDPQVFVVSSEFGILSLMAARAAENNPDDFVDDGLCLNLVGKNDTIFVFSGSLDSCLVWFAGLKSSISGLARSYQKSGKAVSGKLAKFLLVRFLPQVICASAAAIPYLFKMMGTAATWVASAFLRLSTLVGLFGMFSMSAGAINVLCAKFDQVAESQTVSAAALKLFLKRSFAGVFSIGGSLALGMLFRVSIADTVTAAAAWRLDISLVSLLFGSSVGFSFVFSPGCFPGTLVCRHVLGLRIAEGSISLMLPSRRPLFGDVLGLRFAEGNISLMLPSRCVLLLFKCIGEHVVGLATTTSHKGPSYAAAAAATPRERQPRLTVWTSLLRLPLAACFKSTPTSSLM